MKFMVGLLENHHNQPPGPSFHVLIEPNHRFGVADQNYGKLALPYDWAGILKLSPNQFADLAFDLRRRSLRQAHHPGRVRAVPMSDGCAA